LAIFGPRAPRVKQTLWQKSRKQRRNRPWTPRGGGFRFQRRNWVARRRSAEGGCSRQRRRGSEV